MDINSILFILALLILVILYVSQPMVAGSSISVTGTEQEVSALLAERDRILDALSELDFDHSMGKVPEEIYPLQRARLVEQGAEVLRQLDSHQQGDKSSLAIGLETENNNDELEAMIAVRRKSRPEKSAAYCHNCGKPVQSGDRFCANCGEELT